MRTRIWLASVIGSVALTVGVSPVAAQSKATARVPIGKRSQVRTR